MLESTRLQPVTNARASGDYHPGADNWEIGLSSIFYHAIGIAPSKDDWWTTEVQPGSPYGDKPTEPNWQLQALVIALSTGPNGPSDKVGSTNASLVMSTVRGDGLTLQPDRPATTMDAALANLFVGGRNSFAPEVRSSVTAYGDVAWHHVLAIKLAASFSLARADFGGSGRLAVFDWFNPRAGPVAVLATPTDAFTIPVGQGQPSAPTAAHSIRYYTVVPELNGWWLLGEAGKAVPMSKQRVTALTPTAAGFTATVAGAAGEPSGIDFLVATPAAGGIPTVVHCPSAAGATSTLTCGATPNACTCA